MKKLLPVFVFLLLLAPAAAWSQGCAMCTKTASELDRKSARGLNNGILYLAAVPLAILGSLGYIWWRANKAGE